MTERVTHNSQLLAIYARVSTARQEEEETIKTQLLAVREFAKQHSFTIVQEYMDDGWSGDILARPQLDKLRQDVSRKIWQAVLVYDPDRLARRYSYQELIMDELREKGVEVLFVTTPSPKTGEEKILHGVKGLFAEYERVKIAERFRLGKMRKAREGHVLASEAPYGYTFRTKSETDGENGHYEINEREAKIARLIFSWIADERLTIRQVIKRLQELRISPRWSERAVWSTSTLGHLLRNRTYIGEAHYAGSYRVVPENPRNKGKYRKIKKTSSRMKPEDEWIKIPAPTIVGRGLFERVQRQLRRNYEMSRRNRRNEYLLSHLIRHSCGATMAGEGPHGGRHLYYRCTDRVRRFPLPPKCNERGINARVADRLVWNKISELMSSPELLKQEMKRWVEKQRNKSDERSITLEPIRAEIARLKREDDRYARAYGSGAIGLSQLSEYTSEIRNRVSSLEQTVVAEESTRSEDILLPRTEGEIEALAGGAKTALGDLKFEAKRMIVMNIIHRILVSRNELKISGSIPVQSTNDVTFCPIHRGRADTNRLGNITPEAYGADTNRPEPVIPFEFTIALPDPRYERIITDRDRRGRITHSIPPLSG